MKKDMKINIKNDEIIIISKNSLNIEKKPENEFNQKDYISEYVKYYFIMISVLIFLSTVFITKIIVVEWAHQEKTLYFVLSNIMYFLMEMLNKYIGVFIAILGLDISITIKSEKSQRIFRYYLERKKLLFLKASSMVVGSYLLTFVAYTDNLVQQIYRDHASIVEKYFLILSLLVIISTVIQIVFMVKNYNMCKK